MRFEIYKIKILHYTALCQENYFFFEIIMKVKIFLIIIVI